MYGNRIERVVPYGYETISGWRNAGNRGWYMRTNETFQCLCAGEEARKIGELAQERRSEIENYKREQKDKIITAISSEDLGTLFLLSPYS